MILVSGAVRVNLHDMCEQFMHGGNICGKKKICEERSRSKITDTNNKWTKDELMFMVYSEWRCVGGGQVVLSAINIALSLICVPQIFKSKFTGELLVISLVIDPDPCSKS